MTVDTGTNCRRIRRLNSMVTQWKDNHQRWAEIRAPFRLQRMITAGMSRGWQNQGHCLDKTLHIFPDSRSCAVNTSKRPAGQAKSKSWTTDSERSTSKVFPFFE